MDEPKLEKGVLWSEPKPESEEKEASAPTKPRITMLIILAMSVMVVSIFIGVISIFQGMFEIVDYDDVAVFKSAGSTSVTWKYEVKRSGWHYQGFDPVETYDTYPIIKFHEMVTFNDGTRGEIYGKFGYDLPELDQDIIRLHGKFGSQADLHRELIEPLIKRIIHDFAADSKNVNHRGVIWLHCERSAECVQEELERRLKSALYSHKLKVRWLNAEAYIP